MIVQLMALFGPLVGSVIVGIAIALTLLAGRRKIARRARLYASFQGGASVVALIRQDRPRSSGSGDPSGGS